MLEAEMEEAVVATIEAAVAGTATIEAAAVTAKTVAVVITDEKKATADSISEGTLAYN
jgi:hypothetical protein